MPQISNAELHRRAQEWLRIETPDSALNSNVAKEIRELVVDNTDFHTLIAVGDWTRAHANLNEPIHAPPRLNNAICSFAYGMLGYEPDPAKGRLRLRPRFPREWSFATINNVRVGDCLIDLRFSQARGVTRYEIEQVGGAMPVRLIFEPIVSVPFSKALVDGVLADLNVAVIGSDVVAPLQIMLDAKRVVEFLR